MHTHRLQLPKHQHFLDEKRHDPVTGDKFQEGDEVVFCAGCNSAFSVDSWHYMGKKHCNQSITLKEFPGAMTSLRDLEPEEEETNPFVDKLLYTNMDVIETTVGARQVVTSSYIHNSLPVLLHLFFTIPVAAYMFYLHLENFWPFLGGGLLWVVVASFSYYSDANSEKEIKEFIGLGKKHFHQYKKKTHYKQIRYLKVLNELSHYNYSITTTFEINTPDGTFELERVFQGEQTTRMEFFFHLAEIAKHTTVYFRSTEEVDNMTFRRFQREYKGGLRFLEE